MAFFMPGPPIDTRLDDIEHRISYYFNNRDLLLSSLHELNNPPPRDTPDAQSLVRIGQVAVDAIGWQSFWADQGSVENVGRDSVADFIQLLEAWKTDFNMLRVATKSGVYPCLARTNDPVGPVVKAIFGAVWLDAERGLEELKDVLRLLRIIDGNDRLALSIILPGKEAWLENLRTY